VVRGGIGWLSLTGLVASSAIAGPANYCVKPIKIAKRQTTGLAKASKGPTKFLLAHQADTPLAIDEVQEPAENEGYNYNHRMYWKFKPNYSFEGPYTFEYSLSDEVTDGKIIYLTGGRYRTDTLVAKQSYDGKQWEERFFTATAGNLPEQLRYPLNSENWNYRQGRFLPDRGYLISAYSDPPEGQQQHRSFLVQGRNIKELKAYAETPNAVFLQENIEVSADGGDVRIHDTKIGRILSLKLPPTDYDLGSFESIKLDRYGWLFLENYGNDYAVKWKRQSGKLRLTNLVKFTGYEWRGRFVQSFLGNHGTKVDDTYHSNQCVDFSPALRLTLFCNPFGVLHNGVLETIDDDAKIGDVRYIGDASGKGVALLSKRELNKPESSVSLFAFDGKKFQKISANQNWSVGIQDFPSLGRTFISTKAGLAEIVGSFPNLSLETLPTDSSMRILIKGRAADYGVSVKLQIVPGSLDLAAFSPNGIKIWTDGEWKTIWNSEQNPLYGSQEVVPVGVWQGVLFKTNNSEYKLLTRCSS
jgi:hypothetical protein